MLVGPCGLSMEEGLALLLVATNQRQGKTQLFGETRCWHDIYSWNRVYEIWNIYAIELMSMPELVPQVNDLAQTWTESLQQAAEPKKQFKRLHLSKWAFSFSRQVIALNNVYLTISITRE